MVTPSNIDGIGIFDTRHKMTTTPAVEVQSSATNESFVSLVFADPATLQDAELPDPVGRQLLSIAENRPDNGETPIQEPQDFLLESDTVLSELGGVQSTDIGSERSTVNPAAAVLRDMDLVLAGSSHSKIAEAAAKTMDVRGFVPPPQNHSGQKTATVFSPDRADTVKSNAQSNTLAVAAQPNSDLVAPSAEQPLTANQKQQEVLPERHPRARSTSEPKIGPPVAYGDTKPAKETPRLHAFAESRTSVEATRASNKIRIKLGENNSLDSAQPKARSAQDTADWGLSTVPKPGLEARRVTNPQELSVALAPSKASDRIGDFLKEPLISDIDRHVVAAQQTPDGKSVISPKEPRVVLVETHRGQPGNGSPTMASPGATVKVTDNATLGAADRHIDQADDSDLGRTKEMVPLAPSTGNTSSEGWKRLPVPLAPAIGTEMYNPLIALSSGEASGSLKEFSNAAESPVLQPGGVSTHVTAGTSTSLQMPVAPTSNGGIQSQIVHAIVSSENSEVEVKLSPQELGSVRIVMTPRDTGMQVTIYAERQDTLEVLRRDQDGLAADLESMGFSHSEMEFFEERKDTANPEELDEQHIPTATHSDQTPAPPMRVSAGGLDIRF